MKRLLWALRFSPLLSTSGIGLCGVGSYMLFGGPPVVPEGLPVVSVVWMFGDLPWHIAFISGVSCIVWATFFGDAP
jgi:hypothetical protein